MSIQQLAAIEAIHEYGSFAAAANALNLTQSAISMQVASLEQNLEVSLFDRNYRPPRLTNAGKIVLRRAKIVLAQYQGIFDELVEARPFQGLFRLGAIPTVLTNLLPPALMRLRDQEPGLTVNVMSSLSGELISHVRHQKLDAALMHKPSDIGSEFSWRDIAQQRIVILAPPHSIEEDPKAVFATHPYIRFNREAWVAPLIEEQLNQLAIEPDTRAEIQSIEAIHLMVSLGFGASILPDVGNAHPIEVPLRILDFGSPPIYRTIGLLSRNDTAKQNARRVIGDAFVKVAMRNAY